MTEGRRLVIAGAGGFGREVHTWVLRSPRWVAEHGYSDIVFIDDAVPEIAVDAPLLGTITGYEPAPGDLVLVAIGPPAIKRKVADRLSESGAEFAVFVADEAIVGDRVSLGAGTIVCPGVIITSDITIGEQVHLNIGCTIGHDVSIGAFSTLSPSCDLGGGVVLEDDVFLGTAATVLPRTTVGTAAVIGAGAVVVKPILPGVTAVGNPAKPLAPRSADG